MRVAVLADIHGNCQHSTQFSMRSTWLLSMPSSAGHWFRRHQLTP
jgi:hypothetical protein